HVHFRGHAQVAPAQRLPQARLPEPLRRGGDCAQARHCLTYLLSTLSPSHWTPNLLRDPRLLVTSACLTVACRLGLQTYDCMNKSVVAHRVLNVLLYPSTW